MEPKSQLPSALPPEGRQPSTGRRTWIVVAIVAGLVALAVGTFWWRSNRPELRYRRGRAALVAGDRATVLREAERLKQTAGFEPQGRLLAGLLLKSSGRFDKALPELLKASEAEATAVEALTAAAECCYLMGGFADAIYHAQAALAKSPEALDARRWLAAAYYDLGAAVDAAGELEIVSAQDPRDSRSERFQGLIAKDMEHFPEAVRHYRESLRRDPEQSDRQDILMELGESLVKLSEFDEARETLLRCDRTAASLTLIAECEQNLGRGERAHDNLREALRLDPEYMPAYLRRGILLLSEGRSDEAVVALMEAARLAPHASQPRFHLSQAYGRKGEREKADKQLRLMQEIRAREREFTDLHEQASKDPNDTEVRVRIGRLAIQLGRPDLAQVWFRAVLALQSDHPQARAELQKLANTPPGKMPGRSNSPSLQRQP